MKKFYFISTFFITGIISAQVPVKIYAYSQVHTPGNIPVGNDENGGSPEIKQFPVNYYIFATLSPSPKVIFGPVWINGKYYRTVTSTVSTPVVNTVNNIPDQPEQKILVPATKQKAISINLEGDARDTVIKAAWFRNMVRNSELIITYDYKGKRYFVPVKKIKVLPPVAGI
jgi:hypothetical protein